jgi:signal transduction histidine kinase
VTRFAAIPRAIVAALLLTALVGSLLVGWFVSGWRDVRLRQAEIRTAPLVAADQQALALARDLRVELERLIAREVGRPYFHYQNLMHDPQTSAGFNVSRSPLARGPEENLVLGYFQLDAKGRTTTPTVNDDVPDLSDSGHLAQNRAFRDRVAHDLSRQLAPAAKPSGQIAARTRSPSSPAPAAGRATSAIVPRSAAEPEASAATQQQVIRLDPKVYVQNANPNAVYSQQATVPGSPEKPQPVPPTTTVALPPVPPRPVTITISPLEWRTMTFSTAPTLIAVRHVQTPDGSLTQGFVVDRLALTKWLATRSGDMVAELRHDAIGAPVAQQWALVVRPSAASLSKAAEDVDAVARGFLVRFAAVVGGSVLVVALIALLVTRTEKLARERSQFAAAAAHELRTPLAGLQLYGDMLASGLGDPAKIRDYAGRMSEESARLGRVVSNILGFSQLERGNLAVDAKPGPLGDVLCAVADGVRPALDRLGATLELGVASDLRAQFDRDALTQIVGNLLDNAEKYTRSTPNRRIRLEAIDRGDVVEVIVADRGPGVADASKLFHAFSRGGSGGDLPAGLGLGLALSRSLARAMGGDLEYRVRDGGGSMFVLRLRGDRVVHAER